MKLLRAEFQNFRLLRDLKLDFSQVLDKNLTIIRAANDSGKTTILHALQWALYGDIGLPGKGVDFRLHPIDWDASYDRSIPITATVDFEVATYRGARQALRKTRRRYRLVRSAFEDVDSHARRSASTVRLFELKSTGSRPLDSDYSQGLINEEIPREQREVFFTDGDRALSFIEADVTRSTKRARVEGAIRSLLGLEVIEDAIKHVKKSTSEVNRKARQVDSGFGDLNAIASRLEAMESKREDLGTALKSAEQQFQVFDGKLSETGRKLDAALQKGDKEKLQRDLKGAKRHIKHLDKQLEAANKEHSALFRSRTIATALVAPLFKSAYGKLDKLRDQGKIPNTTVPVLQDRLSAGVCICGETLEPGDSAGRTRRANIQRLIDESQRADEIQVIVTELYFSTKPLQSNRATGTDTWFKKYKRIVERRDDLERLRNEAGRRLRALELQVDDLPDTDVQGLRDTLRRYKDLRDRNLEKKSIYKTQLAELRRNCKELEQQRDRLLRKQTKGKQILAEKNVIRDVTSVLKSAHQQIVTKELTKVSEWMNKIFLEMIGADPEQGAIIRRAEISRNFDILVYGPNNRNLNPDRDLNGASRRALTLAFILALTKVSEVEAPNVIDTPLGMTSGFVRRSILRVAVRESTQLILFLTHDEIAGCEEIIEEAAGVVFTLTNPAHYPKMLVNDPGIAEYKILRCECDHKSECRLCQRHADTVSDLDMAS